jgi:hypothetical protein
MPRRTAALNAREGRLGERVQIVVFAYETGLANRHASEQRGGLAEHAEAHDATITLCDTTEGDLPTLAC